MVVTPEQQHQRKRTKAFPRNALTSVAAAQYATVSPGQATFQPDLVAEINATEVSAGHRSLSPDADFTFAKPARKFFKETVVHYYDGHK